MISPESELLARLEKMEQALAALSIQNGTLRSENARLEAENRLLRARIDKLVRRIFGRSSEKISPEQLELLLQFPEDSVPGAERSESKCDPPYSHREEELAICRGRDCR